MLGYTERGGVGGEGRRCDMVPIPSSTDVERMTDLLLWDGNSDIVLPAGSPGTEKMTDGLLWDGNSVILLPLLAQLTLRKTDRLF